MKQEELLQIPRVTTITSSLNNRALKVAELLFVKELPDFLKSGIDGVAYIVDIAGKTKQEIKAIVDGVRMYQEYIKNILLTYYQIAYSCAQIGPTDKKSSSSFLDDALVTRSNMKCTGVKACEYLDPEIQNMQHTEVTTEMLQKIQEIRHRNGADSRLNDVNRLVMYF